MPAPAPATVSQAAAAALTCVSAASPARMAASSSLGVCGQRPDADRHAADRGLLGGELSHAGRRRARCAAGRVQRDAQRRRQPPGQVGGADDDVREHRDPLARRRLGRRAAAAGALV